MIGRTPSATIGHYELSHDRANQFEGGHRSRLRHDRMNQVAPHYTTWLYPNVTAAQLWSFVNLYEFILQLPLLFTTGSYFAVLVYLVIGSITAVIVYTFPFRSEQSTFDKSIKFRRVSNHWSTCFLLVLCFAPCSHVVGIQDIDIALVSTSVVTSTPAMAQRSVNLPRSTSPSAGTSFASVQ